MFYKKFDRLRRKSGTRVVRPRRASMEMDGESVAQKMTKRRVCRVWRSGHSADLGTFWGQKGIPNKKPRTFRCRNLLKINGKCSKEDSNLHRLPY